MKNKQRFRNFVDITPWDKTGNSVFGLKRSQSKAIGLALIVFGILLMSPPGLPDPTDIANIAIANFLHTKFDIPAKQGLLLTYTFIAWVIFLLGLWVYPYNTEGLFNGYINKLKKYISKLKRNPLLLIVLIIIGYFIFKIYVGLI